MILGNRAAPKSREQSLSRCLGSRLGDTAEKRMRMRLNFSSGFLAMPADTNKKLAFH